MRSKHRLGPMYLFFLSERFTLTQANTGARVRAGRRGCMRVSAESRYSQSHRSDSRGRGGGTGMEVSEKPADKVAGDLRRWNKSLDERDEEEKRRRDDEKQGYKNERRASCWLL